MNRLFYIVIIPYCKINSGDIYLAFSTANEMDLVEIKRQQLKHFRMTR